MKSIAKTIQPYPLLIFFLLVGCKYKMNTPFDSEAWKNESIDWWMTDVRENMMYDIIQSDTLIGLHKDEVINLLGAPSKTEDNKLYIFVREKYSTNIDPEYIRYLLVELNENEKVIRVSDFKTK